MLAVTSSGDVRCWSSRPPPPAPQSQKALAPIAEHQRRKGDPGLGGSTRAPIMTAYRPAGAGLRLSPVGRPAAGADLKPEIPDAPKILLHNVYGWFDRPSAAFMS